GIFLDGRLHLASINDAERDELTAELNRAILQPNSIETSLRFKIGGVPHLIFSKALNPNSLFPPAYEVAIYPLAAAIARQREIRNQVIFAGALLLLAGLLASYFLSGRLSEPVEELAVVSEENRAQRRRVEAVLETTSEELQRAARFSADASHQLKTPVSVLRAGIEELLAREDFSPEIYDGLSELLHQTYRMTGMVNDLLLLSRMDAGRLQIQFEAINLSQLIEEWIDDLGALPDDLHVELKTNFPPDLMVRGEKRYLSLIMQNLLENARKYNRPGGEICVYAQEEGEFVLLGVENTGKPIPPAARDHIFERFHRGVVGENVPGHGLGLNLARELARLHGGDLRLVRSDAEWTGFEVRFRSARQPALTTSQAA
ncbi:MAG: HAMP domain-containing sensor histidine kinase, partial [Chthoniobacterales bacterium]